MVTVDVTISLQCLFSHLLYYVYVLLLFSIMSRTGQPFENGNMLEIQQATH